MRRASRLAALAAAVPLAAGGIVLTAAGASAAPGCSVTYSVQNQWNTGYSAAVTVTNLGDPVDGWSLVWRLPDGERFEQGWNAEFTTAGSEVTARNVAWNRFIGTGGSVSFGFNGTHGGTAGTPGAFALNGTTCDGTTLPPTTTTTTATTTTTTTPPPNPAECGSGSFHAEAVLSGGTWTARNGGRTVYTGGSMLSAMQAAADSLTSGRTSKERMVVRGSGSISAGSRFSLPSYTALDVCGTITVTGSGSGDMAPVYARGVRDIEVRHLTVTGSPNYGIFIRNATNVVLGQIDMRLSAGLGVRIDNHGNRAEPTRNVRIDRVHVSGTSSHGVETYGVDGLTIGTVVARNTGYSGLLLNDTRNATVGKVDAEGAGTGTGYAAFRMANRNGRVGDGYPVNIRVGEVVARGGGRGVFCVSESGGAVIDRVDIARTGSNAILIENCYNVTIAAQGGTVSGPGDIRLAARSEFPVTRDIWIQNLTLTDTTVTESPCGQNTTFRALQLNNSRMNVCP